MHAALSNAVIRITEYVIRSIENVLFPLSKDSDYSDLLLPWLKNKIREALTLLDLKNGAMCVMPV